jgi:hypothetical protein
MDEGLWYGGPVRATRYGLWDDPKEKEVHPSHMWGICLFEAVVLLTLTFFQSSLSFSLSLSLSLARARFVYPKAARTAGLAFHLLRIIDHFIISCVSLILVRIQ